MSWCKRAAMALALSLVLAACGSDDSSTDATGSESESTAESAEDNTADGESTTEESNDDDAIADDDDDDTSDDDESMSEDDDGDSDDDSDSDSGDDTPLTAASQAGALAIVSIDFSTAEIQLTNTTEAELDINGWVMCSFPSYAPISGVDPIAPGGTVTVTSTVAVPANDGELAIYIAEDFTNPDSIVTYVEWGSDGHTRSPVAVQAGIWDGTALSPDGDVLTVGG